MKLPQRVPKDDVAGDAYWFGFFKSAALHWLHEAEKADAIGLQVTARAFRRYARDYAEQARREYANLCAARARQAA